MTTTTTAASTMRIAITPMSGSVPACKPNLMPFHINYNGPAAVSTFMQAEKLVDNVKGTRTDGCELQTNQSAGNRPATAETQTTTSSDTSDYPLSLTRTTTESTLVTESSLATLEGSTSNESVPSSSSFSQTELQNLAPPIEEFDKRFISTFRGRSIHGLTINLPDGYGGLVLKATSDRPDGFDETERINSCPTGRRDVQETEDANVDVEMESLGRRRRGRLTSSAAPRKGTVITISDDDDAPQASTPLNSSDEIHGTDIEMAEPFSTPNKLDDPLRTLVPTAQFDSFTLWQADRTVNKSNDEYWRTLTEWIELAHEIHNFDADRETTSSLDDE